MHPAALPPLPQADLEHAFTTIGEATWRTLAGKRIFFTGGTGFVGKWLLATLQDADTRLGLECDVTILSRDPEAFSLSTPHLAHNRGLTLLRGDIRDFPFPAGRFDTIVHAATDVVAQHAPLETFLACFEGTRRVLSFAAQSGATDFLLLSSGAVYGRQPVDMERVTENYSGAPDTLLPGSAYGEGKRVSEWLACAQANDTDLRVHIARCYAFVGPYLPLDKHFAIGNFLRDAMLGNDIVIQGDGTPHRSYLHAADMAAWVWAVLLRGRPGAAYNVGGHEAVSIAELASRVQAVVGSLARARTMKVPPAGYKPERYIPDLARARGELGLPPPLSLDEAIDRTARWHRDTTQIQ